MALKSSIDIKKNLLPVNDSELGNYLLCNLHCGFDHKTHDTFYYNINL